MLVKLFILGLPGSGKSTVARTAKYVSENWGWKTNHINDYAILQQMYHDDSQRIQFKPSEFGGFDVLDLTVFDTALKKLEQEVNCYFSEKSDEIILIEFSRNDYHKAFHQFSQKFLQGAYFLYLAVDIETCKRRIRERIANPTTPDDHFVSDYIFSAYYNRDNGQYIPHILEEDYGIDRQRVMIIDNTCSIREVSMKINSLIDFLIVGVGTAEVQEVLASMT